MNKVVAGWRSVESTRRNRRSRSARTGAKLFREQLEPRQLLATTETWIAPSSANVDWSHDANWSPTGPITPGDELSFGTSSTQLSPVDDVGEAIYGLQFTSSGYDLTGDIVDLSGSTAFQATNSSGTNDINLPLNVTANATATVANAGAQLSIDNTLTSALGTTLTVAGAGELVVSASSNSSGFDGSVDDQGNFVVNGALGDGGVEIDGGVLTGTGTVVGPITATSSAGSLQLTSIFTTGSVYLDPSTTFDVDLNSLASFGQLSSSGPVNLNDAILNVSLNYVPSATDSWVIINNTSNAPVQGTFDGLPQGGMITVNGVTMQINYAAGTLRNQVTLSVISPPVASPDFYTTPENTTLFAPAPGILANDTDPQGLTLHPILMTTPTHGTLTLSDDGSFSYAPATGYSGPDSFTYEATDGLLTSAPTMVSLVVNPVNLPPVVSDVTYSGQEDTTLVIGPPGVLASATSPENLALTASIVSGPSHGTLTLNSDGSFSYGPAAGFMGTDSFTFIATDANGLTSTPATAMINIGVAPDVAATLHASMFSVAENGSIFVAGPGVLANATNPSGNTQSVVLLASTTNGTLSLNSDGSFTYAPNINFAGTDTFTYEATDGTLLSNTATVTITVQPVPVAPTAGDDSYSLIENEPLAVAAPGLLLNDTYPSGSPTITVVNGPLHGTLSLSSSVGGFTYTPATNFSGSDSFIYYLTSDGLISNIATVTFTVTQVPVAPTAGDDSYSVNENSMFAVAPPGVLANDTDPNGFLLSAVLQTAPAHGALTLNSDGSFVYTPTANYSGTDEFTYLANDGPLNSNIATVTIVVNPVAVSPTAGADSFSLLENHTLTVSAPGLLLSDSYPGGTPTITVMNGPLHGTLSLTSPVGGFTYAPNTNFSGTDSFTYFLTSDGLNSNVATVTLTVAGVPVAPTAGDDSYSTNENSTLTVAAPGVLANDVDPNGLPLSAVLQTAPSHGTVSLSGNGSFIYTPTTNYYGGDSFTYLANDGELNSNIAIVSLTIVKVDLPPTAQNQYFATAENQNLVVSDPGILATAVDPNGLALTAVLVTTTLDGTLSLSPGGGFTYVPNANFSGTDSFTFRATNGTLSSNLGTVAINVSSAPAATPTTVQLNPASDTGESDTDGITRDTTPNFYGSTGAGLTVILYAQSAGGSLTPVGRTTADAAGSYSVTSSPLADGTYAFYVEAFAANGSSAGIINAGDLLIDTVSPIITNVIMIPKTGQIYVTFDDPVNGMNLRALGNVSNYSFTRPTSPSPRNNLITRARIIPAVPNAKGSVTVVLKVSNGHRVLRGRYLFAVLAGGATDIAGNPLNGSYNGTFPTGGGLAGSQFDGLFRDHGFKPNVPVATHRFVPVLTKPVDGPRGHAHAITSEPGGPLVHLARRSTHKGK